MPIKILQSNDRVAEVQFICDTCSKIVRTSVIRSEEAKNKNGEKTVCCQCKHVEIVRK